MMEIAVRVSQLISSNLNILIEGASNPAKMIKLLITEIEEAILTLDVQTKRKRRHAQDLQIEADRHDTAQADWNDKARFAMSKGREDLARGALAEKQNAEAAATAARKSADLFEVNIRELDATTAALHEHLAEARQRLAETSVTGLSQPTGAAKKCTTGSNYSDRILERIDTMTKRMDFAAAAERPSTTASLDEELASLAQKEKIDIEMEELRKSLKKKRA